MTKGEGNLAFIEYEKMANDLSKFVDVNEFQKTKWVVTEKIHGANFSFHTDGEVVRVARRRDFLEENENFFNCHTATFMETYPDKVRKIHGLVIERFSEKEIDQVSVYGELFGGNYQVGDKKLTIKPIQPEIKYSPHIEWLAFDASYKTKKSEEHEYLDPETMFEFFEAVEMGYVKPLFVGTMHEALNYEIGFDSTIPTLLGYPALQKGTNKAEGIVVKPMKNIITKTKNKENQRVIVKIKLPEFLEIRHPAAKYKSVRKDNGQKKEYSILQQVMSCYVTEERLVSAITKVGNPGCIKADDEIKREFFDDVIADMEQYDNVLFNRWIESEDKDKNEDIMQRKINGLLIKYKNTNR